MEMLAIKFMAKVVLFQKFPIMSNSPKQKQLIKTIEYSKMFKHGITGNFSPVSVYYNFNKSCFFICLDYQGVIKLSKRLLALLVPIVCYDYDSHDMRHYKRYGHFSIVINQESCCHSFKST